MFERKICPPLFVGAAFSQHQEQYLSGAETFYLEHPSVGWGETVERGSSLGSKAFTGLPISITDNFYVKFSKKR